MHDTCKNPCVQEARKPAARKAAARTRPQPEKPVYAGLDLSSTVIQLSCKLNGMPCNRQLNLAEFRNFVIKHKDDNFIYAMEACGTSRFWSNYIRDLGGLCFVFPAGECRRHNHAQKDDANDARAVAATLAVHLETPEFSTVHPSISRPLENQLDKDVLGMYLKRRKMCLQLTRQVAAMLIEKDPLAGYSYSDSPEATIRHARKYMAELQAASGVDPESAGCFISELRVQCELIAAMLGAAASMIRNFFEPYARRHPVCRLYQKEIASMGLITSVAFSISTNDDLGRFAHPRNCASCFGYVPEHRGTGGRNKVWRMSGKGDPDVKHLIYECAASARRRMIGLGGKRGDKRPTVKIGCKMLKALCKVGKIWQEDPRNAERRLEGEKLYGLKRLKPCDTTGKALRKARRKESRAEALSGMEEFAESFRDLVFLKGGFGEKGALMALGPRMSASGDLAPYGLASLTSEELGTLFSEDLE